MPPKAKKEKTVKDLAAESKPVARGVEPGDFDQTESAPYAVGDQDVSGFVNVAPEYQTYATHVDAPSDTVESIAPDSPESDDDDDEKEAPPAPQMPTGQ